VFAALLAAVALFGPCRAAESPAAASGAASTVAASTAAAALSSAAAAPAEPDANVTVEKIVFAVDVSSRMPVGAADSFDESVNDVFCWTRLLIGQPPARVSHEWYRNGQKVGEMVIQARYPRTRIWSRRKVRAGQWRVEIKDADTGQPIAVGAFVVRKPG